MRVYAGLPLCLGLVACGAWITDEEYAERGDVDGDGYLAEVLGGEDCDDEAADVHPDATEICDTVDHDCDGELWPCVDGPASERSRVVWGEGEGAALGAAMLVSTTETAVSVAAGSPGWLDGALYLLDPTRGESSAADSPAIVLGSAGAGVGTAMKLVPDPSALFVGRPGVEEVRVLPAPEGELTDAPANPPPISPPLLADTLAGLIDSTNDFGGALAPFTLSAPGVAVAAPGATYQGGAARGAVFGYTGDPPNFAEPTFAIAGHPTSPVGTAIAFIDLDGEPTPQFAIGVPPQDRVSVFSAPALNTSIDDADIVIDGGRNSRFGAWIAIRDLFPNGGADLFVAAPESEQGGAGSGSIYVFEHTAIAEATDTLTLADASLAVHGHETGLGLAAAELGDIDGDGEVDLIVGAPGASEGRGAVFLFLGPLPAAGSTLSTADASASWRGEAGSEEGAALGSSVGVAELDSAGHDSILAAAPGADSAEHVDAGAIYVFDLPERQDASQE